MTEFTPPVNQIEKPPTPYDVTRLFNEDTTVEREIIEHLKAAKLGWDLAFPRISESLSAR